MAGMPENGQFSNTGEDKKVRDIHDADAFRQGFNIKAAVKIVNGQLAVSLESRFREMFGEQAEDPHGTKGQIDRQFESIEKVKGKDALPSPEESAGVIVKFATGFYELYKAHHPELSEEDALREYDRLIRGSIKTGAIEALDIIQGMDADSDEAMDRIGRTLDKVEEGLSTFFGAQLKRIKGEDATYSINEDSRISLSLLTREISDRQEKVQDVEL